MIYKKIFLNSFRDNISPDVYLEAYLHDDDYVFTERPAMLIVPGGAYLEIAPLESKPVALRFMSEGMNCFVLHYSIKSEYPKPHLDLANAVLFIKLKQKQFKNDNNLFLMGFSAGGHLVASYSYLYKELAANMEINSEILRPTAIGLAYPVINLFKNTHFNTMVTITGNKEELKEKLSIDKHINKDYPATFLWTTMGDKGVNPSNTFDLGKELKKNNILHETFIVDNDLDHGQSNVTFENKKGFIPFNEKELYCKTWVDRYLNFIANHFYKK